MKRILFLTNVPAPYTVAFFNQLGNKFDLTVLFERRSASNREKEWLKTENPQFNTVYLSGIPVTSDLAFCPGVLRYLRKDKFDLIIVGDYSSPTGILSISYMKANRIPYYIHVDGGLINRECRVKFKIKYFLLSNAIGYMSSGKVTDKYLTHYGANKNNIHHYPFTSIYQEDIISTVFSKHEKKRLRMELGQTELLTEDFIIISVGSIIYRKGYDVLLNAVSMLPKVVGVYIIGGMATNEMTILMEQLHLTNIHFLPFKVYKELKKYLECADLFVLPTREDIWGLVINEAMAAALPVVTTDHCVAGLELIKDWENGLIVTAGNPDSLKNAIAKLMDNQELMIQMGENNKKKIARYTIENMVNVYAGHLEDFV